MNSFSRMAVRGALSLLLAVAASACSRGEAEQAAPPVPPVTVATPVVQEVVDWDEYVGRFEAVQNVEVKPRASGYLQGVHFTDGQFVRRGQLLFTIDPRPAQAALAQARAQAARARATLANARTELARSEALEAQQAASVEEVEQRRAAVRAGEAELAAAQAGIRTQQLNLGFTRVTSPISGRVSDRRVDAGNSVAADQSVLTTIVSINPLHFTFEGSESLLLKYQRQGTGAERGTPVRIRLQDEATFSHAGTLDFVDTVIDAGAGTVRARAVVANPTGFLKPGMFGHARLAASAPYRALLVPETAIVTDASRRVVYLLGPDNVVVARPVELGPLSGSLRVIRSGIGPKDRVVIAGLQRARPGQKVQPKPGRIPPVTGPEPAPLSPGVAPPAAATPVASGR